MNTLARLFGAKPAVVDSLAADRRNIGIDELVDRLASADDPELVLDADAVERAREDPVLGGYVSASYVATADAETWRSAWEDAEDPPPRFPTPSEWAAFIQGRGPQGILLPDDSLPGERLSLFTRVDGALKRVSIEGPGRAEIGLSIGPVAVCTFPDDDGNCPPGCRRVRLTYPTFHFVCRPIDGPS